VLITAVRVESEERALVWERVDASGICAIGEGEASDRCQDPQLAIDERLESSLG
jgi:hypothetical protein